MRIKRGGSIKWSYFCNSFCISLNNFLRFDNNSVTEDNSLVSLPSVWIPDHKTSLRFHYHRAPISPLSSFILLFFLTETSTMSSYRWIFMFGNFHLNEPYMRRLILVFPPSYRPIRVIQCCTFLCFTTDWHRSLRAVLLLAVKTCRND